MPAEKNMYLEKQKLYKSHTFWAAKFFPRFHRWSALPHRQSRTLLQAHLPESKKFPKKLLKVNDTGNYDHTKWQISTSIAVSYGCNLFQRYRYLAGYTKDDAAEQTTFRFILYKLRYFKTLLVFVFYFLYCVPWRFRLPHEINWSPLFSSFGILLLPILDS